MIRRKEDYRFVTEDALKNIAVRGNIFPIRGQKLVLLGEDEAFLREAILERKFYEAGPGGQQVVPYDSRIVESSPKLFSTIGDLFTGIRALIHGRWYDREKLEEESEPITVYDVSGEEPKDSYERMARINEYLCDAQDQINGIRRAAEDGIDKARKALANAKEGALNTRDEAKKRTYDAHDEAVSAADEAYKRGLSSEDERHTGRMKAIEEAYRKAIESGDPDAHKNYIRDKRAELDLNDTNKTALLHSFRTATADADDAMSEGIRTAENAYEEAVKSAEKAAQDAIAGIVADRDDEIEGIEESSRRSAYSSIRAIPRPNGMDVTGRDPSTMYPVYTLRLDYAPEYHAFMKRTSSCAIVKSCLDRYAAQYGRSYPSGTATNRMFADLERLVTLDIGSNIHLYRKATHERIVRTYYTLGAEGIIIHNVNERSPLGGEWDAPDGSSYGGTLLDYNFDYARDTEYGVGHDKTISYTQEDREFRVYYGRRDEVDQIEFILVDILLRRFENKITRTPGDGDDGDSEEKVKDRNAHKYFIRRVKFTKSGICAKDLLARIDALNDAYSDSVRAEDDKLAERLEEIEKDYNSTIDGLDRELQEKYDGFDAEEREKNQRSKNDFVRTACGGLADVNTRIHDERDRQERSRIRNEYITGTVSPARYRMSSEIRQHSDEKEQRRRAASSETEDRKNDALIVRRDRRAEQQKAHDDAVRDLAEEHAKRISEITRIPGDEAAEARRQHGRDVSSAESRKYAAYSAALRKANNALDELVGKEHHTDLDIDPDYWESMSEKDRNKYYDILTEHSQDVTQADDRYYDDLDKADEDCFASLSGIEPLRELARGRFTATLSPIGEDTYKPDQPPSGGSDDFSSTCEVCGVIGAFAVLKPRTLTGVDFSDYYRELEDQEEES